MSSFKWRSCDEYNQLPVAIRKETALPKFKKALREWVTKNIEFYFVIFKFFLPLFSIFQVDRVWGLVVLLETGGDLTKTKLEFNNSRSKFSCPIMSLTECLRYVELTGKTRSLFQYLKYSNQVVQTS